MGDPPVKRPRDLARDYRPLEDLEAVMAGLERRHLPVGTTDPSPLAGGQGKSRSPFTKGPFCFPKTERPRPTS